MDSILPEDVSPVRAAWAGEDGHVLNHSENLYGRQGLVSFIRGFEGISGAYYALCRVSKGFNSRDRDMRLLVPGPC